MAVMDKHDDKSAGFTGSSEEPTLAEMFKSGLTELKDLKQTVAPLVEPIYKDEWDDNVEQHSEELTTAGVDPRLMRLAINQQKKPQATNCLPK